MLTSRGTKCGLLDLQVDMKLLSLQFFSGLTVCHRLGGFGPMALGARRMSKCQSRMPEAVFWLVTGAGLLRLTKMPQIARHTVK